MQSVVLVDYFLPKNYYTYELCSELSKYADVTLICKDSYQCKSHELFHIMPVLHSIPDKNKLRAVKKYLGDLKKIWKIVKERKPDVLHVQGIIHPEFEVLFYKKLKKHVKVLCLTVHNILPHESKKSDQKKLVQICNVADALIVHNERSKNLLIEYIGSKWKERIFIIPHGCYTGYHVSPKSANKHVSFLMFGLLRQYKGVDILMKAISLLSDETKQRCRFLIAGNQQKQYDSTDYFGLRESLNIDSETLKLDIRFIPDSDVEEYFNAVDCVIFPYREIYASGALLMAYSFEKPVIASNIPVFVEETDNGKSGLLFESGDAKQLAQAIEQFSKLNQDQRTIYSRNIAILKQNKYSWKQSAQLTLEAYKRVEALR